MINSLSKTDDAIKDMINLFTKPNDFIKQINLLNKTNAFIKKINSLSKTDDFIKNDKFAW